MQDKGLFTPSLVMICGLVFGCFLTLAYSGTQRALETEKIEQAPQIQTTLGANVKQILELSIPAESASNQDWQQYFFKVKNLQLPDKRGRVSSSLHNTSPQIGLLAVMAKQAPAEFMKLVDSRRISQYAFNYFLEAGLLTDWYAYSSDPERILLENSQALFAIALKRDDLTQLRRDVAKAFLNSDNKKKLDMRSLAFALPSMDAQAKQAVVTLLLGGQYKYDPRSVMVLERFDLFTREQLAALVESQAYSNKSMSSYQFEASKWGSDKYLESMARDVSANAKQPMNFYCALCTLAAFSDGLVGEQLLTAAEDGKLRISKTSNTWVLERERGVE